MKANGLEIVATYQDRGTGTAADGTYWSAGCLQDVQARINNLMVKRRERR